MVKKFMYVCFGILALAVAFHLGSQYGTASIVDHTMSGIVAHSGSSILLENGEVWYIDGNVGSAQSSQEPPVPVSEIKFWMHAQLVTMSNELWKDYTQQGVDGIAGAHRLVS